MQRHELKKYFKFTLNKKPVKMKKYKRFCTRTDRNSVQKNFLLLKKYAKLVLKNSYW